MSNHRQGRYGVKPKFELKSKICEGKPGLSELSHLPDLPNVGVNQLLDQIVTLEERPSKLRSEYQWMPIIKPHIHLADLPPAVPKPMCNILPQYSHRYAVTTGCEDKEALSSAIREALVVKKGWKVDDLPSLRIMTQGMDIFLLAQCKDAETHRKMEKELMTLHLGSEDEKDDSIVLKMELVASGVRVPLDVFTFNFIVLPRKDAAHVPITYEEACAAARHFAEEYVSKLTVSLSPFPEAEHGILGLYRQRQVETWPDGRLYASDTNNFFMAMWRSWEFPRNKMEAYHQVGHIKYALQYPGSDKFCEYHQNNTEHEEGYCPDQPDWWYPTVSFP